MPDQQPYISWSEKATTLGVELRWDPPADGFSFLHDAQRVELEEVGRAYDALPKCGHGVALRGPHGEYVECEGCDDGNAVADALR